MIDSSNTFMNELIVAIIFLKIIANIISWTCDTDFILESSEPHLLETKKVIK